MPQTEDYYERTATYWAKAKPPIFGVLVRALDPELRQQLETNQSVLVIANTGNTVPVEVIRGAKKLDFTIPIRQG